MVETNAVSVSKITTAEICSELLSFKKIAIICSASDALNGLIQRTVRNAESHTSLQMSKSFTKKLLGKFVSSILY